MNTSSHTIKPYTNSTIKLSTSAASAYVYPSVRMVQTKQEARKRILAVLIDDKRFSGWKAKALNRLVDELVDALVESELTTAWTYTASTNQ